MKITAATLFAVAALAAAPPVHGQNVPEPVAQKAPPRRTAPRCSAC